MNVYIRKLLNHDITHEVSVKTEIVKDFFSDSKSMQFLGLKSKSKGSVSINKTTDPRFGGYFKELLRSEGGVKVDDLILIYKDKNQYILEIIKTNEAKYLSFIEMFKILNEERHLVVNIDIPESNFSKIENFTPNSDQIIYYGVPGSGKSHKINEEVKIIPDNQKIRVVFHPEYTNADFIGQVMPTMNNENGTLEYKFIPGPFTKILVEAYKNPDKPYYLIIEEINRGNASAIFGEVFQLLDRIKEGEIEESGILYGKGWSEYGINNDFINSEIKKIKNDDSYNQNISIRIPPNLSILATMNTSDQNVFTLDNAFQRRWNMQLVKNECNENNQMDSIIKEKDKTILWKDFQSKINEQICLKANEIGLSSMEDKRLGCWFVKAEDKKIDIEIFKNKVLKYLWDDAFKFSRPEIFLDDIKNFEELQKKFDDIGFDIFNDNVGLKEIIKDSN